MGGDERLVRSILATRLGTSFDHEEFWVTVLRWLVDQPMLDPVHHAPIIDYLQNERFVASVPNPLAGRPGAAAPRPAPAEPDHEGPRPGGLLRRSPGGTDGWAGSAAAAAYRWRPTGIEPFRHEEGEGEVQEDLT